MRNRSINGFGGRVIAGVWSPFGGAQPWIRVCLQLDKNAKTPRFYNSGEYRSFNGGTSLLKYVAKLRADLGNDWIISVAAHSLGNACTGEALHQGMQVNSYVAMEAAVSLSCYYTETENPPTVPSLVRADDASPTPCYARELGHLGYQGYLSDIDNYAVNRASYFNAVDFWLVMGHTKPTKGRMSVNWIDNHIKYKPDNRWGYGKYKYDSQFGSATFERGRNYTRSVSDQFEGMAFVARSRTRPLGAGGPPSNFQGLDLTDGL